MEQSSVEVYTPHLKKVLKSYQAAAAASLHGPNNFMATSTTQGVTSPTEKMGIVTAAGKDKSGPSTTTSTATPEKKQSSSDYKSASDYDPFLAPPPFPIQQPPIIIPPDQSRCERSETLLEGETISCFLVGGEKRLCFPQVLNPVLRDFSLPQIYSVFSELNIHFSSCNQEQLEILKVTGVLPLTAPSCGLITKSDAERLCAALFHNQEANPKSETRFSDKRFFNFKVYHECFGKCTGILTPELYTTPYSKCIECVECHGMLSPQKFVTHVHRFSENRTCHWGVDSENWRAYLLLSDNQDNSEQLNEHLEDVKSRFDFSQKYKRKQSVTEESEVSKRLRLEEQPFFYPYSSVPWDPALAYWYHITAFPWSRMPAFRPWAAVPSEGGKSHFVSSSLSSHLPYLRDGMAASLPSFLAQNHERIAQASTPYRLQNHHVSSISCQEESKINSEDTKVKEEDVEDVCDLSIFNSSGRKSAESPQAIQKEKEQLTESEETVSRSSSSTLS
ncbi:ski oncogene-like, partial [Limulus polyphemus]|uniref:Ski oncogene-like n=1 Tax=Limulus polyphemus TaxID=6850 RepID=A0ABM1BQU3_LIMPO